MSQKIKAPNDKNRSFLWGIVALIVIFAVVIAVMVINGRNSNNEDLTAADVSFSVSLEDGAVQLRGEGAADDAVSAEVFEDYACSYCAQLAEADSESVQDAVENGEMNVDLRPVSFVDQGGASTRGGAVALAIADTGDAGAFWAFREKGFGDQTTVARTWEWDDYADAAEQLGMDAELVDSIRDGSVEETYGSMLEANGENLNERMPEGAATPALFVEGNQVELQQGEDGGFSDWVPDVLAARADAADSDADATEGADATEDTDADDADADSEE